MAHQSLDDAPRPDDPSERVIGAVLLVVLALAVLVLLGYGAFELLAAP